MEEQQVINSDKKLSFKNYLGYGIFDLGNNLGFAIASSYLTLFYTDVLCKNLTTQERATWTGIIVTIIMVVARIWDGINDPIMGNIVQNGKVSRFGKFRHFFLFGGLALVVMFMMMFLPIQNMSLGWCAVFASVTYIAYGMAYTCVLVPYGSVASVMTRDTRERNLLSIARTIGGGIGGLPAGIVFPLIVIKDNKIVDATTFFIVIAVCAAIIGICYLIGFFLIKEKYPYPKKVEKIKFKETFKGLIHNKPFIVMSILGMLLIANAMFQNTTIIYLFKNVFKQSNIVIWATVFAYIPVVLIIPFTNLIVKKFGKKIPIVVGLGIATVSALLLVVIKVTNPWVFMVLILFENVGLAFINVEIWALAMDVIDYQEYITKKREEASCYAIFTFMRKLGQALAAIVPALLGAIQYDSALPEQSEFTQNGIYYVSTVGPLILIAIMFGISFLYPLTKKKDAEMREQLKIIREEREKNEQQEA